MVVKEDALLKRANIKKKMLMNLNFWGALVVPGAVAGNHCT